MNQVLHILRKDIRHLWPWIVAVFIMVAIHAQFDVRTIPVNTLEAARDKAVLQILNMLLPLGIAFLVANLVFEEPLPGDRQFWIVRPYDWRKLLASKALFIVLFVNVPLFFSDCYILATQSFPVLGVLQDLLLRQIFLTMFFVLPSLVIASVTIGVGQFVFGWLTVLLALICQLLVARRHPAGETQINLDIPACFIVLILTSCGVILWQYARRRTNSARLVLLVIVCSWLPLMRGISPLSGSIVPRSIHQAAFGPSAVRLDYDAQRKPEYPWRFVDTEHSHDVAYLPLAVTGLPSQALLRGTAGITIESGGRPWPRSGSLVAGTLENIDGEYWQTITVYGHSLNRLPRESADFHLSLDLEPVTDQPQKSVPIEQRAFVVPGFGQCRASGDAYDPRFTCRLGLDSATEMTVRLQPLEERRPLPDSFLPPSVPLGLSPTTDLDFSLGQGSRPGSRLVFIPRHKMAAFHRTLNLHDVDLGRYIRSY